IFPIFPIYRGPDPSSQQINIIACIDTLEELLSKGRAKIIYPEHDFLRKHHKLGISMAQTQQHNIHVMPTHIRYVQQHNMNKIAVIYNTHNHVFEVNNYYINEKMPDRFTLFNMGLGMHLISVSLFVQQIEPFNWGQNSGVVDEMGSMPKKSYQSWTLPYSIQQHHRMKLGQQDWGKDGDGGRKIMFQYKYTKCFISLVCTMEIMRYVLSKENKAATSGRKIEPKNITEKLWYAQIEKTSLKIVNKNKRVMEKIVMEAKEGEKKRGTKGKIEQMKTNYA
ncbi:hypothetical protein ACJX0J_035615, partial [Zea mays]